MFQIIAAISINSTEMFAQKGWWLQALIFWNWFLKPVNFDLQPVDPSLIDLTVNWGTFKKGNMLYVSKHTNETQKFTASIVQFTLTHSQLCRKQKEQNLWKPGQTDHQRLNYKNWIRGNIWTKFVNGHGYKTN